MSMITSVVDLAAGKIGELLVDEAKFLCGVEGQVGSLQKELEMVQSFLIDMEAMVEEEGVNERSRTAIKQIRKIAYDAEDAVESYILEANSSTDKTMEEFLRRYICFCSSLPRTHQVGCEIEAIMGRLDKTMEMWKKYVGENGVRLDSRQGMNMKTSRLRKMRPIAYSHTHEEHVVGLDEDINKLVGVLTREEYHEIKVVSVVGMGGSGKTTLARKLFNHESVKQHFGYIAWVSVSQQWDAQKIIVDLLSKVKGDTMGAGESSFSHQVLVGKLYEYLETKSYLIVLDDVWESKALIDICPALPMGGDRRKIIVTTRKAEVVNYPDLRPLTYSHEPRRLTQEESWELFRKIALKHRQELSNTMYIAKLGKEMLKKCRGLPLAVIALAGILFDKENLEEWEKVSRAISSQIMEQGKGTQLYGPVNDMLALSYVDLPHKLKPCFLYLARFPEDHYIHVGELARTWIAEGFIRAEQHHEGCILEDVARRYLDELVHRCLVLVVNRNYEGNVKGIQVHDLVRDLCIEKAKEEDFLEIFTPKALNSNTTMVEPRRATFCSSQNRDLHAFPTNSHHLHSLFIYGFDSSLRAESQSLSLEAVHRNFSLLRVVSLERIMTSSSTLPIGIGSLIHLRYLGLKCTNITELPSSVGNLRNLVTLDWSTFIMRGVIRIPDVLWKLEGLTYLRLPCGMPYQRVVVDAKTLRLHTLKLLRTLKVSCRGGSWMLEELPRLSTNIQKVTILNIGIQEQLEKAFRCPSLNSDRLHSLRLSWMDGITLRNYNIDEPIIHCRNLRMLRLYGRMVGDGLGVRFPASIIKLELSGTGFEAEAMLVALGKLSHLSVMSLYRNAYAGKRWTCRADEFPRLKQLCVYGLENWEEWSIEGGAMPQLTGLKISFCKKLRKVPDGLEFIATLQHFQAIDMGDRFKERIKGGGEDAHIIQRISRVII